MTPGFVAAILEGFDGTLECVLDRLEEGDLKREVATLREHIAAQRARFEAAQVAQSVIYGLREHNAHADPVSASGAGKFAARLPRRRRRCNK